MDSGTNPVFACNSHLVARSTSEVYERFVTSDALPTSDELRSYLIHYGVTPDSRKPEMKAQVRKLISAAMNGMLTVSTGHLICGQKERAKPLSGSHCWQNCSLLKN